MAIARFGSRDKVPRQRRFTQSGTWVVPAGVTWVKARIVGAGAAGRASLTNGSGPNAIVPLAGVPGGQLIDAVLGVTPGSSMSVTVASTTVAPLYSNISGVSQEATLVAGAASSFGGISANGGTADVENVGMVSAGPGSGYGAGLLSSYVTNSITVVNGMFDVSATSGIDGYCAGSGSAAPGPNGPVYVPPGVGGVRARVLYGATQGTGIDAPLNSGAGGGCLTGATGGPSANSWRAGNGGSGIVILDWEEYA